MAYSLPQTFPPFILPWLTVSLFFILYILDDELRSLAVESHHRTLPLSQRCLEQLRGSPRPADIYWIVAAAVVAVVVIIWR